MWFGVLGIRRYFKVFIFEKAKALGAGLDHTITLKPFTEKRSMDRNLLRIMLMGKLRYRILNTWDAEVPTKLPTPDLDARGGGILHKKRLHG